MFVTLVAVFFSFGMALKKDAHLRVKVFTSLLPPRGKFLVEAVVCVLGTALVVALSALSVDYTIRSYSIGRYCTGVSLPYWPIYGVLALSFMVLAVEYAIASHGAIHRLRQLWNPSSAKERK